MKARQSAVLLMLNAALREYLMLNNYNLSARWYFSRTDGKFFLYVFLLDALCHVECAWCILGWPSMGSRVALGMTVRWNGWVDRIRASHLQSTVGMGCFCGDSWGCVCVLLNCEYNCSSSD